jgi:hypothetical protein
MAAAAFKGWPLANTKAITVTKYSKAAWSWLSAYALRQSRQIAQFIEAMLPRIMIGWMVVVALLGAAKIFALGHAIPQSVSLPELPRLILPYGLIALSPLLALYLASRAFPSAEHGTQPSIRLARFGRWQELGPENARRADGYGIEGFLASLVAGLLISILIRLSEYALAMPAIPVRAPAWASALFYVMTLDLVTLSFLYSLCLVMALRGAPLFPRMLVYTWLYDLLMQLLIAKYAVAAGDLPTDIAAVLSSYLDGNLKKVLISVAIWLPYLLVSTRINLTFRHRLRTA